MNITDALRLRRAKRLHETVLKEARSIGWSAFAFGTVVARLLFRPEPTVLDYSVAGVGGLVFAALTVFSYAQIITTQRQLLADLEEAQNRG